jgi:hypothetical protein
MLATQIKDSAHHSFNGGAVQEVWAPGSSNWAALRRNLAKSGRQLPSIGRRLSTWTPWANLNGNLVRHSHLQGVVSRENSMIANTIPEMLDVAHLLTSKRHGGLRHQLLPIPTGHCRTTTSASCLLHGPHTAPASIARRPTGATAGGRGQGGRATARRARPGRDLRRQLLLVDLSSALDGSTAAVSKRQVYHGRCSLTARSGVGEGIETRVTRQRDKRKRRH